MVATADDSELSSYLDACPNGMNVPYEVILNHKVSEQYIENEMKQSIGYFDQNDVMFHEFDDDSLSSVSHKWAMSVLFSIFLYIFVWLPLFLLIATILMLYNVNRRRSFDINCHNICYGLIYFDTCCCVGKCKKHKKFRRNFAAGTTAKFHGIPTFC